MMRASQALSCLVLIFLLAGHAAAQEQSREPDLDGAAWIWAADAMGLNADQGTRYFRAKFTVPASREGGVVRVTVTADNLFSLYLNGTEICTRMTRPDAWDEPQTAESTGLLVPGANTLAVAAVNTAPGAAGLLVKLSLTGGDGTQLVVVSDEQWKSTKQEEPGWMRPQFDDAAWPPVQVLGDFGMPPWGRMGLPEKPAMALDFAQADWIWTPESASDAPEPAGTRYFRTTWDVPQLQAGQLAHALVTADNVFALYINGRRLARGTEWTEPQRLDVTSALQPGNNVIAIRALNTIPGPAGLIAKFMVSRPGDEPLVKATDGTWVCTDKAVPGWHRAQVDDGAWQAAYVQGAYGIAPWGDRAKAPVSAAASLSAAMPRLSDYSAAIHRESIVFVQGMVMFGAHGENFIQNISGTRAYTEFDTASPGAVGQRLYAFGPFEPGGKTALLCDAGQGLLGSPSVSYDGRTVYFTMAPAGDAYFHVYAVDLEGGAPRQITSGPFHDFDPVQLPDGRLAFSSTRVGTSEEYHGIPAFALFSCDAQGRDIRRITAHIVGDREPRVAADGSLVFVRCDNFFERAKVETHIQQTRPDGTGGKILIGPDRPMIGFDRASAGEVSSAWLRVYGAGVPVPLPDGRVAAITERGVVASGEQRGARLGRYLPYDMSPLPDGRVLCTDRDNWRICIMDPSTGQTVEVLDADALSLPLDDAEARPGYVGDAIHSAVYAGPRPVPPAVPPVVNSRSADAEDATGYLYCQSVYNTRHTSADVSRIRAVRVFEGRPFTLVPTRSIYVHIGVEGRELGTVPVAPDGSFSMEVPANRALSLQAVDAEGRAVISELSWLYVRPGERRSCVGCHAASSNAPPSTRMSSASAPPIRLTGGVSPHSFRANNAANGGVLNQQFDRFREAGSINLHWQSPLAAATASDPLPPGRSAEVRALCELAQGPRPDERISALQRLGVFRDREAIPTLLGALSDESAEVCVAAAMSLAACGDSAVLAPLCKAADDPRPVVSRAARVALEQLTGERLPDQPGTWAAWLDALDPAAHEQVLCRRLKGDDRLAAMGAIEALGHTGSAAGAAALRAYVTTNPDGELRILMAALRALGRLRDREAIPLIAQVLNTNLTQTAGSGDRELGYYQRPVYLAATAAEALGYIGGEEAEGALVDALPDLKDFSEYTLACGDHPWLVGCHSSVLHYRILEALDSLGTVVPASCVPGIVRSLPIDKDRALLLEMDSYETLVARVVQRSGRMPDVLETCLSHLGEAGARRHEDLAEAVSASPHAEAHIRPHSPAARAAQVLSVACLDPSWAPRIGARAAAYLEEAPGEERSWVCFMLLRALGRLRDPASAPFVREVLESEPNEASYGFNPPPNHWPFKAMKPFYRAAAAYAVGELGDTATGPLLRDILNEFGNAPGVRWQAAVALGKLARAEDLPGIEALAAEYPDWATRRALWEACDRVRSR